MIRLTAFNLYLKEFLHGLRNGLSSDEAGQKAMVKVREAFDADPAIQALGPIDKFEHWGRVFETLIDFRISTRGLPIDVSAIPPKGEMDAAFFSGSGDQIPIHPADVIPEANCAESAER